MFVLSKDEVQKAILTYAKRVEGAGAFGTDTDVVLLPDGGARLYTDRNAGPMSAPQTVTAPAEDEKTDG
jgi:hypothetical protein